MSDQSDHGSQQRFRSNTPYCIGPRACGEQTSIADCPAGENQLVCEAAHTFSRFGEVLVVRGTPVNLETSYRL
jgi:hypothetical protein